VGPSSEEDRLLSALQALARADGWVTDVPFADLAQASGVGLRSIPRHIDRLVASGRVHCMRERGRGRRNSYRVNAP
jgi:predicted ArsR family transcriptional regulator